MQNPESHAADEGTPSPDSQVEQAGRLAKQAAPGLASLPTSVKNAALEDLADALLDEADALLAANERDYRAAQRRRLDPAQLDLLELSRARLGGIAASIRAVAALPDPVGEILRGSRRPNGLVVQEVRVPLGVVGMIYESRPHTTCDAISLCLKSSNGVVLLGGADVLHSNAAILDVARRATARHGIPETAMQLIETSHPRAVERMLHLTESLDVLIPRGTPELIRRVCSTATVPTIETGPGNCHIFVERSARLDMAANIALNAKVSWPLAVNAMETLLVDRPIADEFLPIIGPRLQAAGVELLGCAVTQQLLGDVKPATEQDYHTEFLAPVLAVRVVDSLDQAIRHIARYGTHHSEAIVTQDYSAAKRFCEQVNAAAVYVNASTRFTDGFELGLGAELGISTQKLHRRGPIGLRALTTLKWVIHGEGQVRD
jgi:glutamate-5-semialdehyde dehydrogenase